MTPHAARRPDCIYRPPRCGLPPGLGTINRACAKSRDGCRIPGRKAPSDPRLSAAGSEMEATGDIRETLTCRLVTGIGIYPVRKYVSARAVTTCKQSARPKRMTQAEGRASAVSRMPSAGASVAVLPLMSLSVFRSEEHTSELQSLRHLV